MKRPDNGAPNFEDEFERAVADWRERHRLREDDAVLLLVDFFRIHQRHWDDLRRRELPSFEQFRGDITKLIEDHAPFKNTPGPCRTVEAPIRAEAGQRWSRAPPLGWPRWPADSPGYLLGRAWP
ncbi:MAG: hypothetical protein IPK15_18560 [Verrucomicrobia bacterium]|nr:hypothetical protein [Verrucomicrobiota bacterium]